MDTVWFILKRTQKREFSFSMALQAAFLVAANILSTYMAMVPAVVFAYAAAEGSSQGL